MSIENYPQLITKKDFNLIKSELFVIGNQTFEQISPLNAEPVGVKVFFGGFEGDSNTNFRSLALQNACKGYISILTQNPGLHFNKASRARRLLPSGFVYVEAINNKITNEKIPQLSSDFGKWLDAPQVVLNRIVKKYPELSIDIIAHSLGGLGVLSAIKQKRYEMINNVTLLAPFTYKTVLNARGFPTWGEGGVIDCDFLTELFVEANAASRYNLDLSKSLVSLQEVSDRVLNPNARLKIDHQKIKAVFTVDDEIVGPKAIADFRNTFPDIITTILPPQKIKKTYQHDLVSFIHSFQSTINTHS
jgi:hypothetical protein